MFTENKLNKDQKKAIALAVSAKKAGDKAVIISGAGGVGKSYLVPNLINALHKLTNTQVYNSSTIQKHSQLDSRIIVTATTNEAKKVLGRVLDHEVFTIHKVLGLRLLNSDNSTNRLLYDPKPDFLLFDSILIVDEFSYISPKLFSFIQSKTKRCFIVYIGDKRQLLDPITGVCPVLFQNYKVAELSLIMRSINPTIHKLVQTCSKSVDTLEYPKMQHDNKVIFAGEGAFESYLRDLKEHANSKIPTQNSVEFLSWKNTKVLDVAKRARKFLGLSDKLTDGEFVVANETLFGSHKKSILPTGSIFQLVIQDINNTQYGIQGFTFTVDGFELFASYCPLARRALLSKLAKTKKWRDFFKVQEGICDLRSVGLSSTVYKAQGRSIQHVYLDLKGLSECNNLEQKLRMINVGVGRTVQTIHLLR